MPDQPNTSVGDQPTLLRPVESMAVTATFTPSLSVMTIPNLQDAPPGFIIEQELGRGGMGIVYLARQQGLNRPVALKMILDSQIDQKALIRFLAEAESVASIQHPNVVEVYQFGEHGGRPYMALEFCSGGSLSDRIKDSRLEPRAAAEMMSKIAEGVQAAHSQGMVHRDLKPHNIMLNEAGEPKVSDFGLAKKAALHQDLTKTNAVMGTPAYMSPEQAQGGTKFVGPTGDVWSLGVMLYEMLSGERPFRGESTWAILGQVMNADIESLSRKQISIPPDLVLIVDKCLQREPFDRYANAGELAADLQNWLTGKAVSVRPAGSLELLLKWVRRNKRLAAAISVAALAMLVGTTMATLQAIRARLAETEVRGEKARAESLLMRAELFLYANALDRTAQAIKENRPGVAGRYLTNCRLDLRNWEHDYLWSLLQQRTQLPVEIVGEIDSMAISPDGRIVVVSQENRIQQVTFGQSGFFTWNPVPAKNGKVTTIVFNAAGKQLACGDQDHSIQLWNVETRQPTATLIGQADAIRCMQYSPDGQTIASGGNEGGVYLWEVKTGTHRKVVAPLGGQAIRSLAFSPDGKIFATGGDDRMIRLWDVQTGELLRKIDCHTGSVRALAFSSTGAGLVSGGQDRSICLSHVSTGTLLFSWKNLPSEITDIEFDRSGTRIVSVSQDHVIRRYTLSSVYGLSIMLRHTPGVNEEIWRGSASASHSALAQIAGKFAVVVPVDENKSRIQFGDIRDKVDESADSMTFDMARNSSFQMFMGPNGLVLHGDRSAFLTLMKGMAPPIKIASHPNGTVAAVFSADGTKLVTGGKDGSITLWQTSDGKEIMKFDGHRRPISFIQFLPDGQSIASGSEDQSIKIWSLDAARERQTLKGLIGAPTAFCVSPDGKRYVGSESGAIHLWDVSSGLEVFTIRESGMEIRVLRFSPDGRNLIGTTAQHQQLVWEAPYGQEVIPREGHEDDVKGIAYSSDFKRIFSWDASGHSFVWDATSGQVIPDEIAPSWTNQSRQIHSPDARWTIEAIGVNVSFIDNERRKSNRQEIERRQARPLPNQATVGDDQFITELLQIHAMEMKTKLQAREMEMKIKLEIWMKVHKAELLPMPKEAK